MEPCKICGTGAICERLTGKHPEMTPQIYSDFNGYCRGDESDWVELDTYGTLVDLHFYQICLEEGLPLTAWDHSDDDEVMEVTGQCRYHGAAERPHWCLHFEREAFRYVPTTLDRPPRPWLCFKCRSLLPQSVRLPDGQVCPACGLSIHHPWGPPVGENKWR